MPSPSIVLLRTQSDARLVTLARDGHDRAFEAIVERYRRQLLRACRRVLPEARAEDALQQALVAAWRGLERGDEVRELRPWLHRIAHNTALNLLRQSGYDYDELQESLRIADAAEDELERRAVVRQTLQGLATLPPRQREALLAIAVDGRSQDEVAGQLGLSTGAVRQLVHRARTALRAAATAVVPLPLVSWAAAAGPRGELVGRVAELSAGAGGAGAVTALAKAGTVVVLAGGVVVGPALVQKRGGGNQGPAAAAAAAPRVQRAPVAAPPRSPATPAPAPAATRRASGDPAAAQRAPGRASPAAGTAPRSQQGRGEDDEVPDRSRGGASGGDREKRSGEGERSSEGERSGEGERFRSGPSVETTDDDAFEAGGSSGSGSGSEPETDSRSGSSRRGGSSSQGSSRSGSGDGGSSGELDLAEPAPSPAGEAETDGGGPGSGSDD